MTTKIFAFPAPARVKVLDPIITTGPSMHAEILSSVENRILVRVPKNVIVGAMVQVRSGEQIAFGEVRSAASLGAGYEIGVDIARSA
jgi:hypothetical protein